MTSIKPHPYQERGRQWIIDNPDCGLFLPMGAGKTPTVLLALDELINDRFEVNKVLIIGPVRVITTTWPDEIRKWGFDLTYSIVSGTRAEREAALAKKADLYLVGKENTVWLTEYLGRSWDFDMVVVDELSAFKNPQAKRFKALRRMSYSRFVGLTGTPTPKGLPDLWSQVYLIDRGERLFPSLGRFRSEYLYPAASNGHIVYRYALKPGADRKIQERIADICMSISPQEYATLPDRALIDEEIDMGEELSRQYREFKKSLVLELDGDVITAQNAGVLSGKLLQFSGGMVYDSNKKATIVHDLKVERLMKLIDQADGEPVVIFYYYQHERKRLEEVLQRARLKYSTLDKPGDIAAWNRGELDALLIQPQSAGHGLNLQAGGHIAIWYTLPNWSLEAYEQANARLYRQGQKQKVRIYHLIAKGTVDRDMLEALKEKTRIQERLLEAIRK